MKLPKLAAGMALYTIGSFIPKAINFFLLPVYTRFLCSSDVGIIGALQSMNAVVAIILTLGFERGVYRLFYDYTDPAQYKRFVGTVSITAACSSFAIFVLFCSFPQLLGSVFKDVPFHPYVQLMLVACYLNTFSLVPLALMQTKEQAATFIKYTASFSIVKVLLNIFMLAGMGWGVKGILIAEIIANLAFCPIYIRMVTKEMAFIFDVAIFRNCASFSVPFLPGLLSSWVLGMSARLFIERYSSLQEVGVYTVAEKVCDVLMLFVFGFIRAYNPYFYRVAHQSPDDCPRVIGKINRLFVTSVIVVAFVLSVLANLIMLLFGSEYAAAADILPILLLSLVIGQMASITNNQLYQARRSDVMSAIVIASALLSMGMNLVLVDKLGMIGAACSLLIVNIAVAAVQVPVAQKMFRVNYDFLRIGATLVVAILFALASHFIVPPRLEWLWKGSMLLMGLVTILAINSDWNSLRNYFYDRLDFRRTTV